MLVDINTSEEVDPSQSQLQIRVMSGLIEQQDILITLVEQIAHGGHATTKKDAVTSSCDDTPAPADQKLPGMLRHYTWLSLIVRLFY